MNPAWLVESGVCEEGRKGLMGVEGEEEEGWGDKREGNPVPAKWLIPLIPQISNVKS